MWVVLLLFALCAGARGEQECDACLAGRCHARRTRMRGFNVTDQLAIDRAHNILYTQLDNDSIVALNLDDFSIRKLFNMRSRGLAFDQENELLYTSMGPIIATYKDDDASSVNFPHVLDRPTSPVRLRYEDTLYTINADGSSAYYSKHDQRYAGYENLQDYVVSDMVNVKAITNWYFVSDNKLYKFVISPMGVESWHLLSDRRHVLSIGRDGANYFADPSQRIIYKLDRETGELKEYGSYKSGSVEDFVFDRDENIVFLDGEGSVAQWVPTPEREGCDVTPRGPWYRVDDFTATDDLLISLLTNRENTYSSTGGTVSDETWYD